MSTTTPTRSGGCALLLGIGCLSLILLVAIGGGVLWYFGSAFVREASAAALSGSFDQNLRSLDYPDAERLQVMQPIQRLAGRIRNGEVSLEQGMRLHAELVTGSAGAVVLVRGFEHRYLPQQKNPAERDRLRLASTRFTQALAAGKVPTSTKTRLLDLATEPVPAAEQSNSENHPTFAAMNDDATPQRRLKAGLSEADIESLRTQMSEAADLAGIAPEVQEVDVASVLIRAIDQVLQQQVPDEASGHRPQRHD